MITWLLLCGCAPIHYITVHNGTGKYADIEQTGGGKRKIPVKNLQAGDLYTIELRLHPRQRTVFIATLHNGDSQRHFCRLEVSCGSKEYHTVNLWEVDQGVPLTRIEWP